MFQHPLPHARCTRLLRVITADPSSPTKLLLEISILDLDEVGSVEVNHAPPGRYPGIFPGLSTHPTDYDALSYTWGSPFSTPALKAGYTQDHDVSVEITTDWQDRHPTKISRNLCEALTQMWLSHRGRYLWVDALCIKQDDLEEKARHVLLMSEIYSKAFFVFVWLGVDDPDEPTYQTISWFGSVVLEPWNQHYQETGSLPFVFARRKDHTSMEVSIIFRELDIEVSPARVRAIYRFFARRRYFTRGWITQEVALARKAVLLLRHDLMWFKQLYQLTEICLSPQLSPLMLKQLDPEQEADGLGTEIKHLGLLSDLRRHWNEKDDPGIQRYRRLLHEHYGANDTTTEYLALLEHILSSGHQRRTSDPRDTIYSLLGLLDDMIPLNPSPIRPDYTKSVVETYIEMTALLLRRLPYRTVLSLACEHALPPTASTENKPLGAVYLPVQALRRNRPWWMKDGRQTDDKEAAVDSVSGLPSWVPDFSTCLTVTESVAQRTTNQWLSENSPQMALGSPYEAGFDDHVYSPIHINGVELSIHARYCGRVIETFRYFSKPNLAGGYGDVVHGAFLGLLNLLTFCNRSDKSYPNGQTFTEAMFQTMYTRKGDGPFNHQIESSIIQLCFEAIHNSEHIGVLSDYASVSKRFEALRDQPCIPSQENLGLLDRVAHIKEGEDLSPDDQESYLFHCRNAAGPSRSKACSIFLTENRYLGVVSTKLETDDEIWLICQARVPFALRRKSDGKFTLLGEAYVHGGMFGELIKNGVASEPREITIV